MEIKMQFDTKQFMIDSKSAQRAVPRAIKFVVDSVAKDLRTNYQEKTVRKLDIVQETSKLRPFTKNAVLFKRANLKNLTSHVFMKDLQYEYLKHTIDKGMVRFRNPKRNYLLVPDKGYNRRKSYGQPQRRGGVKRENDFWLPNRHGGFTLFERKGGKLKPIWHTANGLKFTDATLPYYSDMMKYIKKKSKYYTGKLFRHSFRYNLRLQMKRLKK